MLSCQNGHILLRKLEHGVDQCVITTRIPEFKESTYKWLDIYYPWIDPNKIFIRDNKTSDGVIDGDIFKGITADRFDSQVHFDDSVTSVAKVSQLSRTSSILFPRSLERGRFQNEDRVIELPDMQIFDRFFGLHQDFQF